jgi:hypothetical protein
MLLPALVALATGRLAVTATINRWSSDFAKQAPRAFKDDRLVLFPLGPELNFEGEDIPIGALDYEALRVTQRSLNESHGWFAKGWGDFKVEANIEEMRVHLGSYNIGESYDMTVLSTDHKTCIGCVYLRPVDHRSDSRATRAQLV